MPARVQLLDLAPDRGERLVGDRVGADLAEGRSGRRGRDEHRGAGPADTGLLDPRRVHARRGRRASACSRRVRPAGAGSRTRARPGSWYIARCQALAMNCASRWSRPKASTRSVVAGREHDVHRRRAWRAVLRASACRRRRSRDRSAPRVPRRSSADRRGIRTRRAPRRRRRSRAGARRARRTDIRAPRYIAATATSRMSRKRIRRSGRTAYGANATASAVIDRDVRRGEHGAVTDPHVDAGTRDRVRGQGSRGGARRLPRRSRPRARRATPR